MKTAVSIPDQVFADAERLARRLKKSRSRLYSEALAEYVVRHDPDQITAQMNRALAATGESSDAFTRAASRRVLRRTTW